MKKQTIQITQVDEPAQEVAIKYNTGSVDITSNCLKCFKCGFPTIGSGTCHTCHNCGETSGCS